MSDGRLIINPKLPKGEDGYRTFSIRIKDKTVNDLEKVCAQTGHSRNELIGILLDYALEHCDVRKADNKAD